MMKEFKTWHDLKDFLDTCSPSQLESPIVLDDFDGEPWISSMSLIDTDDPDEPDTMPEGGLMAMRVEFGS